MGRVNIKDLPKDFKISKSDMKKITGGWISSSSINKIKDAVSEISEEQENARQNFSSNVGSAAISTFNVGSTLVYVGFGPKLKL